VDGKACQRVDESVGVVNADEHSNAHALGQRYSRSEPTAEWRVEGEVRDEKSRCIVLCCVVRTHPIAKLPPEPPLLRVTSSTATPTARGSLLLESTRRTALRSVSTTTARHTIRPVGSAAPPLPPAPPLDGLAGRVSFMAAMRLKKAAPS
jgi:hypothetical protein